MVWCSHILPSGVHDVSAQERLIAWQCCLCHLLPGIALFLVSAAVMPLTRSWLRAPSIATQREKVFTVGQNRQISVTVTACSPVAPPL